MRDKIFLWLILGFAGGILLRSFFDFGLFLPIIFSVVAFSVILSRAFWDTSTAAALLVAAALFGCSLGMLRYEKADLPKNPLIESFQEKNVAAEGVVVGEPDERENSTLLYVRLDKIEDQSVNEKILAVVELYPKISYGDEITLSGKIQYPQNFETDTGRVFDYRAYLAKEGITYEMTFPKLSIEGHEKGNPVLEALFTLKEKFLHNVEQVIPEPDASLLGGLVVGAKHSLGKELLDDFRTVGVVHIVVLSGYNVTIVADFIQKVFSFLPRYVGIGLGSLSIVFFALMTGATATTVRASIMALLAIVARATGRTYVITRALVLAGFFMLLQNPHILVFDTSFQLSFLSTLALIYVSPLVEARLLWIPEKFGLREIVTATISTQIFVLPFLLYTTGIFSVVSLPANLLILPLVPVTMLFGFLAGTLGFVNLIVAAPFSWAATALLSFMLFVVKELASAPFAAVVLPAFPFLLVMFWYGLYAYGYVKMRKPAAAEAAAGAAARS